MVHFWDSEQAYILLEKAAALIPVGNWEELQALASEIEIFLESEAEKTTDHYRAKWEQDGAISP